MQPPKGKKLAEDIIIESQAHLAGFNELQIEAYKQKILACFNHPTEIPTRPTSIEDLAKILSEHQRWIRSALDPNVSLSGNRAILCGASLRGAKLAGTDLRGANLSRADLSGADLQGCNLGLADLSHANFTGALMSGAILKGAVLTGADLTSVDMNETIQE